MTRRAASATLAVVALAAGGCGDDARPVGDARTGGAVVIATPAPPDSLDPALASTSVARQTAWLAYTPPLTYRRAEGAEGTEIVPALSRALPETSDDGRTYSFAFRRGLRYPTGAPLRASDFERAVARSVRLSARAAARFRRVVGVTAYAHGDRNGVDIPGIAVDDDAGTVTIELTTPDRLFPHALATTWAAPVPRGTELRDLSEDPPAGIGPYRVSQVRRNGDVVLERRRRWRLPGIPAGYPHEIVTRTVPDLRGRVRAVLDGRADLVEGQAPVRMLPDIRSKHADRYEEHSTLRLLYVSIDAGRAPFRDGDVRRALSYALDAGDLARIHDGFLTPSCNVLPPAIPGYRRADPCPFGERLDNADLVEASRLVRESGAVGASVTVAAGAGEHGRAAARHVAATLSKIGLLAHVGSAGAANVRRAAPAPAVPHPSAYLRHVDDPVLRARVRLLEQEAEPRDSAQQWAEIDGEVVERALLAPYGVAKAGVLASERLDFQNCSRFHPVMGMDYSSLCLK
ncbi:MAG: ABC transporter substrate-binding protein [Thermoleophilaceae bacterium]